jgi:hypothetical protein
MLLAVLVAAANESFGVVVDLVVLVARPFQIYLPQFLKN